MTSAKTLRGTPAVAERELAEGVNE
jgi:hypothetical protein